MKVGLEFSVNTNFIFILPSTPQACGTALDTFCILDGFCDREGCLLNITCGPKNYLRYQLFMFKAPSISSKLSTKEPPFQADY